MMQRFLWIGLTMGLVLLGGAGLHSCASKSLCNAQERACEGNVLLVCVGDQEGWLRLPCSADEVCLEGKCQLRLQPVQDAGSTDRSSPLPDTTPTEGDFCSNEPPRCADTTHRLLCLQSRWVRRPCEVQKVCTQGKCQRQRLCQEGERRCKSGREVEVCFQGQWQSQTCPTGQRCALGQCEAEPVCQERAVRCVDPYVVETCRNGTWERERCAVAMYCQQGACVPQNAPCQDGATRCIDAGNLDTCKQGSWSTAACPQKTRCEQGACVPVDRCQNGARRCASLSAQEVCVQGVWKQTACQSGQQCQGDRCVTLTNGRCQTPCGTRQICQNGRCASWSETYRTVSFVGKKTDRSPPQHADLNLKLRGWRLVAGQSHKLVSYNGATDPHAPKLATLFPGKAFPGIVNNYQVGAWDWTQNAKSGWITTTFWKVHLVGFQTQPGAVLRLPSRSPAIHSNGARAMVLYLDSDSITLVYTREDTVANGYALHVQGVHLPVDLTTLYQKHASRGDGLLPALTNNQPFATAIGNEILISIRDRGQFMDPRSKKDWW